MLHIYTSYEQFPTWLSLDNLKVVSFATSDGVRQIDGITPKTEPFTVPIQGAKSRVLDSLLYLEKSEQHNFSKQLSKRIRRPYNSKEALFNQISNTKRYTSRSGSLNSNTLVPKIRLMSLAGTIQPGDLSLCLLCYTDR